MDCDVIDLICLGLARNGLFLFQFLVQMLHLAVYRVQIKGCTGKTDRFICNLLAEHRVVLPKPRRFLAQTITGSFCHLQYQECPLQEW